MSYVVAIPPEIWQGCLDYGEGKDLAYAASSNTTNMRQGEVISTNQLGALGEWVAAASLYALGYDVRPLWTEVGNDLSDGTEVKTVTKKAHYTHWEPKIWLNEDKLAHIMRRVPRPSRLALVEIIPGVRQGVLWGFYPLTDSALHDLKDLPWEGMWCDGNRRGYGFKIPVRWLSPPVPAS